MKFFIDIGNTNFKICDENDLVKIFLVNEFYNFLKSFNPTKLIASSTYCFLCFLSRIYKPQK